MEHAQINDLWNQEYPLKLRDRFALLLEGVENFHHYFMRDDENNIFAWAVIFEKENETRFSLIVSEKEKAKGYGSMLLSKLKKEITEFYGWVIDHDTDKKINGENYKSPLSFYTRHGFEVLDDPRIDNDMLKAVKVRWKIPTDNLIE
jgi:hypothetical protein